MTVRKTKPRDALVQARFTQIATFGRLPYSEDLTNIDGVFLGIPFDDGTTYRTGARNGPSSIREQSRLLRSYNYFLDIYPFDVMNFVDYGDVDVVPGYIEDTFSASEKKLRKITDSKVIPFIAGGDHSVTLPILRALSRVHGKLNIIHLDSHFDFWDQYWGKRYTHGTWLRRAIDEDLVNNISQGGMHGSFYGKEDLAFVKEHGIKLQTIKEFHQVGAVEAMKKLCEGFNMKDPLYISFDIDVVDPAYAPGTGTPEVGGITSWQALEALRSLIGFRIVGFDVVEVSPQFDPISQNTSLLAANLIYEMMSVVAKNKANGIEAYVK
ncbi:MAG: agmatinase [Thermoplasmata archaeon]